MKDPRIDVILDLLSHYRTTVERAFQDVPTAFREIAPGVDEWSAANVVEHLADTERAITGLLIRFLAEAPARAHDDAFDPKGFEQSIDMHSFLDRSQRIEGPQPSGTKGAHAAWEDLQVSRGDLLAVLEQARGRKLDQCTHAHPVTGASLNAYQWLAFLGVHEGRHAAQLEEIRSA